ncbi:MULTISPECIES: C40 family peptidase [Halocynthiibacter]|uniref:C40 family peptidase n=1 Tax=Halocynthiibacter halioticoli TaxID=2986804 RepID=A0AAE3J1V2_9RHOB|nr:MULTISPECIES: C40 family peptidase [Halocynthiibacter]MCV6825859.1 C40 family peptidase [Halocynthiibacter halioticoli]MCW4058860.1 C40 family peptidase [Halocynthiibacter sp. SDUM655004]
MDRRGYFANERVAHPDAEDAPEAATVQTPILRQCRVTIADVCASSGGARDTQLLYGEQFEVLETMHGWSFGRTRKDGYVGYVEADNLGPISEATHSVCARATHLYPKPDMKQKEVATLSLGSMLSVLSEEGGFAQLASGAYIPLQHIRQVKSVNDDPASVAGQLLGTPYLWGGSSAFGIDCSGLVQMALMQSGLNCPRDSDQQMALGHSVLGEEAMRRGDLVFWKGHVGMMLDEARLIHANAHHMAVAVEAFAEARKRIGAKEFGEVLDIRRLGD